MIKFVYLNLLVAMSQVCAAYKILVVFPLPYKSHHILGKGIVRHLLEASHEVTYITPFPTNETTSKYHEIDISDIVRTGDRNFITLHKLLNKKVSMDLAGAIPRGMKMTTMVMTNSNLRHFLMDTSQKFDVVIAEWLFSDVYCGFAAVFNCPLVWSTSTESHSPILRLIHESSNPAYNTDVYNTVVPPFTFFERVESLWRHIYIRALKFLYYGSIEKKLYEDFFGPILAKRGRALPLFEDAVLNGSFLLTNSHPSLSQPIRTPLNSKEIGGYHINPKPEPLPMDLQALMDETEHGIIYFSMGSHTNSKDFPDVLKQNLLRVLGEVEQTVIWKFEEDLPSRPENVHIVPWAPQQSILAHPNCRLFITHGGLLSTTEAIFFGVPTIVIPYGADQSLNAIRAVKKGYALKTNLSYKVAGELKLAIGEMLTNPKYKDRVKALSEIYRDRMVSPGKELVHRVEHVARTRGAPHLRSPALMLTWYQKMYLDLAAVVVLILYILKWVFIKVKYVFHKKAQAPINKAL